MPFRNVTIVGGGLAGLALGIGLRRRDIPVTVWEAGCYPRHRVCGEFISGRGQRVLEQLQVIGRLREAGAGYASTAAFFVGEGTPIDRPLPEAALCLSRFDLDRVLANCFREMGGELRENERWPENEFGEGVVRATGRRLRVESNGWRWFGLKAHAMDVELSADLEMHAFPHSYIGLCRLKEGRVNVCGLFRRHATASPAPGSKLEMLGGPAGSALRERLGKAKWDEASICAVAGLHLEWDRARGSTECRIGDALTMIPPVTGNGMSMAFESAELAIEPLIAYSRGELSWAEARQSVARACDGRFGSRLQWARWLQWMMFSPLARSWPGALALRSKLLWRAMFVRTR